MINCTKLPLIARFQPGQSMVTILRPVRGGEDIAICQSRFAHDYREVGDV